MDNDHILALNTQLKFYEFVLGSFDVSEDDKTIGDLKRDFTAKFKCQLAPMINQYFGLIRLVPLMYIAEEKFGDSQDRDVIRKIRNAFAHNSVECTPSGYQFNPNRENQTSLFMSYLDIVAFVHRVENGFHNLRNTDGAF